MNKEVNEKKKTYAIVITFLVLMICITGGTYAYFALTASNNSVTGSVGGASLNLEVTRFYIKLYSLERILLSLQYSIMK